MQSTIAGETGTHLDPHELSEAYTDEGQKEPNPNDSNKVEWKIRTWAGLKEFTKAQPNIMHAITTIPSYQAKSFEELRWEDYQAANLVTNL